jgi:hypothetical protein
MYGIVKYFVSGRRKEGRMEEKMKKGKKRERKERKKKKGRKGRKEKREGKEVRKKIAMVEEREREIKKAAEIGEAEQYLG